VQKKKKFPTPPINTKNQTFLKKITAQRFSVEIRAEADSTVQTSSKQTKPNHRPTQLSTMNPPPPQYFALCAPPNVRTRLTDLEDENRRLLLAKSELEQRFDAAWKQTTDFHAIAERATAENTELRACKRKLSEELCGALAENSRLQAQAQAADAKRLKAEAEAMHASSECRRQANAIRQMEDEASETRKAAESRSLEKQFLSSSLQNSNTKVKGLTAEVLDLKAKQAHWIKATKEEADLKAKIAQLQRKVDEKNEEPGKVDALKAKVCELKTKNEALEEENRKLKAQNKDRASRLANILALAQGGGAGAKAK
jgi:hypothetical protein